MALDPAEAVERARAFPGLAGMDLAKVVSCNAAYTWDESEWRMESGYGRQASPRLHVVAYEYGIKRNIMRKLAGRGCRRPQPDICRRPPAAMCAGFSNCITT